MNLSGGVNEAMYKSRSYAKMRIWPRFSAQAFRNQADNRPNRRDLYMESSFCRCFPVQARLVQEPSSANEPSQDITKNAPHCCEAFLSFLSGKRDSNSRPRPWQGRALPTELFPQYFKDPFLLNGTAKIRQNSETPNIFAIFLDSSTSRRSARNDKGAPLGMPDPTRYTSQ